jgi:chromatin structure-remodeling complex protein RSC7
MLYPKIMQPTHARWEQLPTSPHLNGAHPNTKSSTAIVDLTLHREPSPPAKSIFTPIPPVIARNFLTADTVFIRPPISNVGVPGPDGGTDDVGPPGLMDIPDDIIAELPQECRIAFKEAREQERRWKSSFGTERDDGNRADIKITYNGW